MRRKRTPLPAPVTASIEKLSHEGRGVTRVDGKVVFVDGALAGETVRLAYVRTHREYDEAVVEEVLAGSPDRIEPRCPHAAMCGGCSLQHLESGAQIREKEALLLELLRHTGKVEPEETLPPLQAQSWHYRTKARLSVRFVEKKAKTLIGFRERVNPRFIAEIESCAVLDARVDNALMTIRALLDSLENPRAIAQIEVAASDERVALIFRNLVPLSAKDEAALAGFAETSGFIVCLQPGGPDSVYLLAPADASMMLEYSLEEEGITYRFHPTDFTQVNPAMNALMVREARRHMELTPDDSVLDLFCGLGNFSLALAKYCRNVMGVEGSSEMVERARMNAQANGITNASFEDMNLDAPGVIAKLSEHGASKLLIDPPRSGALEIVRTIDSLALTRIVYISCNPVTLARDAGVLVNEKGYRLVAAGVMDMFPHTAHVESMAVFEKR